MPKPNKFQQFIFITPSVPMGGGEEKSRFTTWNRGAPWAEFSGQKYACSFLPHAPPQLCQWLRMLLRTGNAFNCACLPFKIISLGLIMFYGVLTPHSFVFSSFSSHLPSPSTISQNACKLGLTGPGLLLLDTEKARSLPNFSRFNCGQTWVALAFFSALCFADNSNRKQSFFCLLLPKQLKQRLRALALESAFLGWILSTSLIIRIVLPKKSNLWGLH